MERVSSQPTDLGSIFGMQPKTTMCACSNNGQHYPNTVLDVVLPGTPDKIHELIFASWFIKEFYTENQGLHGQYFPLDPLVELNIEFR